MIDSKIDLSHDVFKYSNVEQKSFAFSDLEPEDHGTALASIFCGRSSSFSGLIPEMHLFSASVFNVHQEFGKGAITISLILGLDWLVRKKVPVINMSLTGPPNSVLQLAIEKLVEKGVAVVAAAGNEGPMSPLSIQRPMMNID